MDMRFGLYALDTETKARTARPVLERYCGQIIKDNALWGTPVRQKLFRTPVPLFEIIQRNALNRFGVCGESGAIVALSLQMP